MSDHTNEHASKPRDELRYIQYDPAEEEKYLPTIRELISKDLSEPYSIYVYRYFLYQWGDLCYMVCMLYGILGTSLANIRRPKMKPVI